MVSSSGSLDTSVNSHHSSSTFTFSSSSSHPSSSSSSSSSFMTSSFSHLLASSTHEFDNSSHYSQQQLRRSTGSGVPKFKTITPPSLAPISPHPVSPSSYFSIPPGLSPAELLDSPVLWNPSNILPSPTTGTFPAQTFNWKPNSGGNNQQDDKFCTDFSFQPPARQPSTSQALFQSSNTAIQPQEAWSFQEVSKLDDFGSSKGLLEYSASVVSSSLEFTAKQTSNQNKNGFQSGGGCGGSQQPQYQSVREQRRSEDGYNWRKYGQKQVKGSENPRSYYKCTYPNCPTKKKVERSIEGEITEIVYKGSHNHPKPQSSKRSSATSSTASNHATTQIANATQNDIQEQSVVSYGSGQMDSVATPENSSVSIGNDEFDSQKSKSGGGDHEFDEDEPDAKRGRREGDNEGISASGGGNRTVREPRVVVQTTSDIDILDDGYRWRKYGQKVVKGNPNPRSYYKCTHPGCPVRKHVERASHDLRAVITTYEGKHNHDVPAARGSHAATRAWQDSSNNNAAMAVRPLAMSHVSNNSIISHTLDNTRLLPASEGKPHFDFETSQSGGGLGFSGFGNIPFMNQSTDNVFSRAKEEPRDDLFLASTLV